MQKKILYSLVNSKIPEDKTTMSIRSFLTPTTASVLDVIKSHYKNCLCLMDTIGIDELIQHNYIMVCMTNYKTPLADINEHHLNIYNNIIYVDESMTLTDPDGTAYYEVHDFSHKFYANFPTMLKFLLNIIDTDTKRTEFIFKETNIVDLDCILKSANLYNNILYKRSHEKIQS